MPRLTLMRNVPHAREIDLEPSGTAGTMRRFDSPDVRFVMGFSLSYMHWIRSWWHSLKTGQSRDYTEKIWMKNITFSLRKLSYNILEFQNVVTQFSQRKITIFHPDFFLCNSMDQYSRFRTSRTPRTVTGSSGTIFSSKTTSFFTYFWRAIHMLLGALHKL